MHRSQCVLIPVLVLAGLFILPSLAQSQCMTASVYAGTSTSGGMDYIYVVKVLSTGGSCTATMSMNVIDCFPGMAGFSTSYLTASAFTTAVSPTCQWACDCGPVTIDSSDGLPVELMEFSVEDDVQDEAEKPEESDNKPSD